MIISPSEGSFFFLAMLLTTLELEPTTPLSKEFCADADGALTAARPMPLLTHTSLTLVAAFPTSLLSTPETSLWNTENRLVIGFSDVMFVRTYAHTTTESCSPSIPTLHLALSKLGSRLSGCSMHQRMKCLSALLVHHFEEPVIDAYKGMAAVVLGNQIRAEDPEAISLGKQLKDRTHFTPC